MLKILEDELEVLKEFDDRKKVYSKENFEKGEKVLPFKKAEHKEMKIEQDKKIEKEKGFTFTKTDKSRKQKDCIFCNDNHASKYCTKYKTVEGRVAQMAAQKRCTRCLSQFHETKACDKELECFYCKKKNHLSLLCEKAVPSQRSENSAITASTVGERKKVCLMSIMGEAKNKETGKSQEILIFFDYGSNRSFITKKLSKDLKLKTLEKEILTVNAFGGKQCKENSEVLELELMTKEGEKSIFVNSIKQICDKMEVFEGIENLPEKCPDSREPDLLIGLDYFWQLVKGKKQISSTLTVIETVFGDIVLREKQSELATAVNFVISTNEELKDWQIEASGLIEEEKEESVAYEMFQKSMQIIDGRYQVGFPWKPTKQPLPSNLGLAYGRLKSVTNRLRDFPQRAKEYDEKFKEQKEQGIIEVVPPSSETDPVHYLPHHAVFNPEKPTTKLRIVFDGSAKTRKENPSINECLFKGKTMLPELAGILLRSRTGKILLTGDIEKAFHQMLVNPEDRDMCRFLWLKDVNKGFTNDNIEHLRFKRVLFGLICSPFLLAAVLKDVFEKFGHEIGIKIFNDTYVDNIFIITDDIEEAKSLRESLCDHFSKVSMNIREWLSNKTEVMKSIPTHLQQNVERYSKVLGVKWDFIRDEYLFSLEKSDNMVWSKRQILTWMDNVRF